MNNDSNSMPLPPKGIYRHFKGGEYRLLHLARHSETDETMVVYQALYACGETPGGQGIWVRPLSMWLTLYTHNLADCDPTMWSAFDALSMWTWNYADLRNLQENFELMEKKFPEQKKYLGIYMFDYPSGEPIPNEYMELQCEYGLKLLQEGRADGLIFLTNCVMGVGLPSEYWLRDWIDRVKNIEL